MFNLYLRYKLTMCILLIYVITSNMNVGTLGVNIDHQSDLPLDDNGVRLTAEYNLRQGSLRGLLVRPSKKYEMGNVEIFLGVPYAAPPTGKLRFMPPGNALPWSGLNLATNLAPVCPQKLPDVSKVNPLTSARLQYINRILKFLKNESEDCLYLNIYIPRNEKRNKKLPILVYIHGESFEWGSGNPYDGRILAAYGNIIVITLNYRLGILGFLKPTLSDDGVYGNNGLLDILAALQWIKDNIADLNGDPDAITLMGHGTGAICVHYLMLSPISNSFFHRAILMSGSAFSSTALSVNPQQYTLQVAQLLKCRMRNESLMECLQSKSLEEIQNLEIFSRKFETPLGPTASGVFIPSDPQKMFQSNSETLRKFDLLIGVSEIESYHDFNMITLTQGMLDHERDAIIKEFVEVLYNVAPDVAMSAIFSQYAPANLPDPQQWSLETNRDIVLDIISDGRVVAPAINTAIKHSALNNSTYFYVYGHNAEATDFTEIRKSVHGQELPFVFGMPIGDAHSHFHGEYSNREKVFSEFFMKKLTNFIKFGSPNNHHDEEYLTTNRIDEVKKYNVYWPHYDQNQPFFKIDIPSFLGKSFREKFVRFWNALLPEKLKKFKYEFKKETAIFTTTTKKVSFKTKLTATTTPRNYEKHKEDKSKTPMNHNEQFGIKNWFPPVDIRHNYNIYREIKSLEKTNNNLAPPVSIEKFSTHLGNKNTNKKIQSTTERISTPWSKSEAKTANVSSSLYLTIVIIASLFAILNVAVLIIILIKKNKIKFAKRESNHKIFWCIDCNKGKQTKTNNINIFQQKRLNISFFFKRRRNCRDKTDGEKQNVCKTAISDDSGGFSQQIQLKTYVSTSTLDIPIKDKECPSNSLQKQKTIVVPNLTKSEETLAEEINKYEKPMSYDSTSVDVYEDIKKSPSSSSSFHKISTLNESKNKSESRKISSNKINVSVSTEDDINMRYSNSHNENNTSIDCIDSSTLETTKTETKEFIDSKNDYNSKVKPIIYHKHSKSDPITDINAQYAQVKKRQACCSTETLDDTKCSDESKPDPTLISIRMRNYPKVLPDFPNNKTKRYSLQASNLYTFKNVHRYEYPNFECKKIAPAPPVRQISTLGRNTNSKNCKYFDSTKSKSDYYNNYCSLNSKNSFKTSFDSNIESKFDSNSAISCDSSCLSKRSNSSLSINNSEGMLEDDLIDELVGKIDGSNINTDTKGPDVTYRRHEIVKINTNMPTKSFNNYVNMPEQNTLDEYEKTAEIKQTLKLNRLLSKSGSIEEPPEKICSPVTPTKIDFLLAKTPIISIKPKEIKALKQVGMLLKSKSRESHKEDSTSDISSTETIKEIPKKD